MPVSAPENVPLLMKCIEENKENISAIVDLGLGYGNKEKEIKKVHPDIYLIWC